MEEKEKKTNELKEISKEIVGWEDNKLIRTLRYLTTNPGQVISEYCNGEKHKYLSPIIYFFGVNALETYLASAIGLFDYLLKKNLESMQKSFSNPSFSKLFDTTNLADKINSNLAFAFSETGQKLIITPLLLLLTWLFFKKYNRSIKDNSWFALYTLGHGTLLTIPFMMFWYFTNDLTFYTTFSFIILFAYWVWASKQFYSIKLGKAILLRFVMMTIAMLTLSLATFIMVFIVLLNAKK